MAIDSEGERISRMTAFIRLLGPILPDAQVDLTAFKRRILDAVPHDEAASLAGAFSQAEEENRSVRDVSASAMSHWALRREGLRIVPYLLARGADPNGDLQGNVDEPVLVAAAQANPSLVPLILRHGARIDVRGANKRTALHAACEGAWPETVALLIAGGADVRARTYGGRTPLHMASSRCPECVRTLLAAGAEVDARDDFGRTPLREAPVLMNLEAATLLLDAGANPNVEDRQGVSPYIDAISRPKSEAMRKLMEAHGGRLTAEQLARRAKAETMMRRMQPR